MKKVFLWLGICGVLLADVSNTSILQKQRHLFSFEQKLQRQHFDQMRYDAPYQWRGWGTFNTGGKYAFVGEEDAYVMFSPLVGFDRSFGLEEAMLVVGVDVDVNYSQMKAYAQKMEGVGYGLGAYTMWLNELGYYAGVGLRFFQGFFNAYGEQFSNIVWLINFNAGKRFELIDEYFIDADFYFGTGTVLDKSLSFVENGARFKHTLNPMIPLNFRAGTSFGKRLEKQQQVRISVAAELEQRLGGEIWIENQQSLKQLDEKTFFDIFCSIAYDVKIAENAFFYTYADFATLRLQANFGLGLQVSFGELAEKPLKYPRFKLKKLPNTDLK